MYLNNITIADDRKTGVTEHEHHSGGNNGEGDVAPTGDSGAATDDGGQRRRRRRRRRPGGRGGEGGGGGGIVHYSTMGFRLKGGRRVKGEMWQSRRVLVRENLEKIALTDYCMPFH